ncbi:DsbA family oxidoreductase [Ralstonia sp. TCR112]|uniref:DsbA family oxidoreductase n=1 Tax=Ralstonia sp. TCR112 TaxID=2601730 RepID=UPI0011BE70E0|nr:DsbA family oxidoreductase [Ralstonia sp. TCR112]TXD61019.1 DsbA family oxidoreductase [Ralstonia sp. TCR112]
MNSFDRPVRGMLAGANRRRTSLTIDVFFDFICPWCWIGTRHLASALRTFATLHPEVKTKVRWRPYPLLPDTPAEGLPYQAFYLSRLGSPTAVSMRRAQVQRAGQAAGIDFDFSRINVLPNTERAHGVVRKYRRIDAGGHPARLIERIFIAYFVEGADIGDEDVLQRLEFEHNIATAMALDAGPPSVCKPVGRGVTVSGLPHFVFNADVTISGAHPASTLVRAMQNALSPSHPPCTS